MSAIASSPWIVGVRHHSPACARLVAERIRTLRPAYVLIEGPADFNARLHELFLPHRLPVAIYSYLSHGASHYGSWTPFAQHSPEWQALVVGREVGAALHFIDLPGWHKHMHDCPNRYADQADAQQSALVQAWEQALQQHLHIEGSDALWDHLFEDDALPLPELQQRLTQYFEHLRGETAGSPANQQREQMMARWIAWAMAQTTQTAQEVPEPPNTQALHGVLVVCGGYHAPALARLWPQHDGSLPITPEPTHEDIASNPAAPYPIEQPAEQSATATPAPAGSDQALRYGSYLVPYSFKRLDAFTGYAAGMPSPGYYQWVWEGGLPHAGQALLGAITRRLREKKLPASTADLMALHVRAQALARLRAHPQPQRRDWLDALAGALVKEGLDAPLPWTYRGPLLPGTDPILVEIMDVLCGQAEGHLAEQTPLPPLVHSVRQALRTLGLGPGEHTLDLLSPHGRACSRLLHCLHILRIPGFVRLQGPSLALSGQHRESWHIGHTHTHDAALIEAAAWGPHASDAARALLEHQLAQHIAHEQARLQPLAELLNQAAWAGLNSFSATLHSHLRAAIDAEQHFERTGYALELLYGLWQHGQALGMQGAPVLAECVHLIWQRALWLLEAPAAIAAADTAEHLLSYRALRRITADALAAQQGPKPPPDLTQDTQDTEDVQDTAFPTHIHNLTPALALAVWQRKAADPAAAPLSRGAALGALLSLAHLHGPSVDTLLADSLQLLHTMPSTHLGDALAGLLALGRQQLGLHQSFIATLDVLVQGMDEGDFLQAMPAMRAAFAWLPARERGQLAAQVLRLHHAQHLPHSSLTRADPHPEATSALAQAQAQAQERRILHGLATWGLRLATTPGAAAEAAPDAP